MEVYHEFGGMFYQKTERAQCILAFVSLFSHFFAHNILFQLDSMFLAKTAQSFYSLLLRLYHLLRYLHCHLEFVLHSQPIVDFGNSFQHVTKCARRFD